MKRAIGKEQKEVRRRAILDSALYLFEDSSGTLSTVASIAARSGVGKGTIYLYFKTREEIYLALLEEFIDGWFDTFERALEDAPVSVENVIGKTCRYIEDKPVFMRLASIFNGILEKNIDYETAYGFKLNINGRVVHAGKRVSQAVNGVKPGIAGKLILRSFALSIGLWQVAEPAPIAKQVLAENDLEMLKLNFIEELKEALVHLWSGAVLSSQG